MLRVRGRLALRLALSFVLPTLLGLLAIGVLADRVAQRMLEDQLSERLISIAQAERAMLTGIFAAQLRRVDAADSRSLINLRKRLLPIAEQTSVRRVFVFHPTAGTCIVDTDESVEFGHRYYELDADSAELEAVRRGESRASVLYSAEDGTLYKYAYTPVLEETGELIAIIGVEGSARQLDDLQAFRRSLTGLGAAAVLLVLIIALYVSRRLTLSVHRLAGAAERIGGGNLGDAVPQTRTDELGDLEGAIEAMRQGLKQREEDLQMMLSGIAHEVRNPLGGIELFLGLLDEDLQAEMREPDPRREHVARITRELAYLARVVNEFLAFARHSRLDITRFEGVAFIDEIAQVLTQDVTKAEVELRTRVQAELCFTADRDRLRRVVLNLVQNALQASRPGAEVRVMVESPTPLSRRIVVRDYGVGIPQEKLADVFRPFFTTREKGTGLGLPLARKVIEAHGGTVIIESQKDEGTTVTITLPFDETLSMTSADMEIPEGWLG